MRVIRPVVRTALHQQVADQLAELIVSSQYRPGELLPPERELTTQFSVSRTVIREAIRVLATKGLVEVRQGQGARVREQNADSAADALRLLLQMRNGSAAELLEARGILEPGLAALAAERAGADQIEQMRQAIERLRQAVGVSPWSVQLDAFIEADSAFHAAVAHASCNEVLISLMEALRDLILLVRRISFQVSGRITHTIADHDAILAAIAAGNSDGARAAMQHHIGEVTEDVRRVEAELGLRILAFDPAAVLRGHTT